MTMSLEDFRASLIAPDPGTALGLPLTDVEAQQVAHDPASTQSWYAYWLSIQPAAATPPPPADPATAAATPPPAYEPSAPSTPSASSEPSAPSAPSATTESAMPGDAQATVPIHDAMPAAAAPATSVGQGYATPVQQGYATPADPGYAASASPTYTAPAGDPYAATLPYPGYDPSTSAAPGYPGYAAAGDGQPVKKRRTGLWVTLSILGSLLVIAAIVVIFAFATARHWTKTDVPERPETFRSEEFETGRYDVAMDSTNPCTVNQDWTDCTDLMAATYTASCVGVELTESAAALCTEYSGAIDEMRALDGDGYYVATLGTYGTLSRTPEIDTRQVSNDDYRPAETHEAVCYLGFLGECE